MILRIALLTLIYLILFQYPLNILHREKIITFLFIANIHYFGPFILGDFFFFILAICCLLTEYLIVISFEA